MAASLEETPSTFAAWRAAFEDAAARRGPDADRRSGARLSPAVARSVRRFQLGESGDGAGLIAKAVRAGDPDYAAAVRLFVAEESEHARLLGEVLHAAGVRPLARHWTDTVFVRLRRPFGLRAELLTLMLAEVVALRYYRAMRDGARDPLVAATARRILDDERRHVPFHCARLRGLPAPVRRAWLAALAVTAAVVALDHGPALREFGVTRRAFVRETLVEARAARW
ncbi:ferritin-like domain-containing protein [Actinomadura atramentaria]|uniref:ferritin-like domain-containing protein n=1 Tax=Actinomadura atramentaria TaxID=1990 RepID=UPI000374B352|nr:ferritin-like domain-containing protein [Actinomadura atramentaria]